MPVCGSAGCQEQRVRFAEVRDPELDQSISCPARAHADNALAAMPTSPERRAASIVASAVRTISG
jgi:hypothetical protein